MGFVLLAMGIGTPVALFWLLFHLMGHSFVKASLFFSAGILHRQYLPSSPGAEDQIGDLFRLQPFATFSCIIGFVAISGTPLFPIFLSKFGILLEAAAISLYIPVIALILFAFATAALFRYLVRISGDFFEVGAGPIPYFAPVSMRFPIIILLFIAIISGIFLIPGEEDYLLAAVRDISFGGK
jgi:hydrogenase-4 component F